MKLNNPFASSFKKIKNVGGKPAFSFNPFDIQISSQASSKNKSKKIMQEFMQSSLKKVGFEVSYKKSFLTEELLNERIRVLKNIAEKWKGDSTRPK